MTSFLPHNLCSVQRCLHFDLSSKHVQFYDGILQYQTDQPINTWLYYQICSCVSSWQRKRCGRTTFWHDETHTDSHDVASANQVTQVAETWTVIISNFPHVQTFRQTLTQTRALLLKPSAPDAHKQHDSLQTLTYYSEACKELTGVLTSTCTRTRSKHQHQKYHKVHVPVVWTCNNSNDIRLLQNYNCVFCYIWLISLRHDELFLVTKVVRKSHLEYI